MAKELHNSVSVLIISRGGAFNQHLQSCVDQFSKYQNIFVVTLDNSIKFLKNCKVLSISGNENVSDTDLEILALQHFFLTFPFPSKILILHEYELMDVDLFESWLGKGSNFDKCMTARFAARRPFYKVMFSSKELYPSAIYLNFNALNKNRNDILKLVDDKLDRLKLFSKLKSDAPGNFEGVVVNGNPVIIDAQFIGDNKALIKRCEILGDAFNQDFVYNLQFLIPSGEFVGVDIFGNSSYLVLDPPSFLKASKLLE